MNCIGHLLVVISTITECVSISAFASRVGIPIGIASSSIGLKNLCKKYKSITNKKKKKYDKIVLLAKSKLKSIKVLIYKTLIDSNLSRDESVLMNNVLKEFHDMKKKNKKW